MVLILGNKVDCENTRKVSTDDGRQIARNIGAIFGEVSAKTGEGIDEVILKLTHLLIN